MPFTLSDYFLRVPGDLQLDLEDGQLQAHRAFLMVASTAFSDAFTTEAPSPSMKAHGSLSAWTYVLEMLYPIYPRPEMTFDRAADMLPVLHMYNFISLIHECIAFLQHHLPARLSPDPQSRFYVTTWLTLADDLQLEELREMCMQKVRELTLNRQIEGLLFAPARVSCQCGAVVEFLAASTVASCQACNTLVRRQGSTHWFQDDKPRLADGIKKLSQQTQEELLVSVVMACGGTYSNTKRPAPM